VTLSPPSANLEIGNEIYLDDYADINSISVNYGRTNLAEQPSTSTFTCTYSLIQSNTAPPNVNVGDRILWAIDDPTATGGKSYLFWGSISDISATITNWRNGNGLIEYTITGIGPLSWLDRDKLASNVNFARQYEGTRIAALGAYTTWTNWSIETPGGYEVAADNKGGHTILEVAQMAAQSGLGLLYEDLDTIYYESYATRINRSTSYDLDSSQVIATNLGTTTSVTNIANSINLTYGAQSASNGDIYQDLTSSLYYGPYSATRPTELHHKTDANTQAQILLAARSTPKPRLSSVTINLANPAIGDALKSDLIATRVGQRISLEIPTLLGETYDGFIEGYSWNIGRNQQFLTLTLSSYDENKPYTMWYNVGATEIWSAYATSTTKWSDIT